MYEILPPRFRTSSFLTPLIYLSPPLHTLMRGTFHALSRTPAEFGAVRATLSMGGENIPTAGVIIRR